MILIIFSKSIWMSVFTRPNSSLDIIWFRIAMGLYKLEKRASSMEFKTFDLSLSLPGGYGTLNIPFTTWAIWDTTSRKGISFHLKKKGLNCCK